MKQALEIMPNAGERYGFGENSSVDSSCALLLNVDEVSLLWISLPLRCGGNQFRQVRVDGHPLSMS